MNDNSRKTKYINQLLKNKTRALTGNSLYKSLRGLICEVYQKETNLCKCPKAEAEAKERQTKSKEPEPSPIKKNVIKNMDKFKKITERLNVMARSHPLHKML